MYFEGRLTYLRATGSNLKVLSVNIHSSSIRWHILKVKHSSIIKKFLQDKFRLSKFKMEMVLASMDLWDISNRSEKDSLSNAILKC